MNMRYPILLSLIWLISLGTMAQDNGNSKQTPRYGYFSYNRVLRTMPEYTNAINALKELQGKYDNEIQRAENEFNEKYEQFLEGQKDFAPSIRNKRQVELQELVEKNVAFKKESVQLMQKAKEEALAPLKSRIQAAINTVIGKKGYLFIFNTDTENSVFLNTLYAEDATMAIIDALQ